MEQWQISRTLKDSQFSLVILFPWLSRILKVHCASFRKLYLNNNSKLMSSILFWCCSFKRNRIWNLGICTCHACCCYVWVSLVYDSDPFAGSIYAFSFSYTIFGSVSGEKWGQLFMFIRYNKRLGLKFCWKYNLFPPPLSLPLTLFLPPYDTVSWLIHPSTLSPSPSVKCKLWICAA